MALIVRCRECRTRIPQDAESCPACGCTSRRYIVDYWPRGRHGGRTQRTLPDQVTTVKEALEWEKAITGIKHRPESSTSPLSTVEDLFPSYLAWYRSHRAATTWHDVSGAWDRDLKRILGQFSALEISAAHYSLYQKTRGKVSNRTVNKELDYFSGFLRWCRREKKLDIPRVDYDRLPYKKPVPIVLSPGEIIRIISACESEPFYHAFFLSLYTLGVRIGAVRRIKLEDFDFENAAVRVLQKGGDWKLLPMSEHMIESVKRLIELNGLKAGDYVFSIREGKPIQNVRRAIARICKRANVTKKVNPHLFRHTLITHLIVAGVPTRTAQDYADHREITTTEGYTHIALENLRAAQDRAISTRKPNDSAESLYGCEYNI